MENKERIIEDFFRGAQAILLPKQSEGKRDVISKVRGTPVIVKHPSVGGYAVGRFELIPENYFACNFVDEFTGSNTCLTYHALQGIYRK